MAAKGTPAIDVLRRSGVSHRLHEYDPEPAGGQRERRPAYGAVAAAALGVHPGRLLKTLVAEVDGRLVAAVVPVDGELDLKRLAAACRGRRAVLAAAVAAERATGYVVGGISPLGQRRRLMAVLDASALGHDTVYVSGGRRGLQIELAPGDLRRLTDAVVADLRRTD